MNTDRLAAEVIERRKRRPGGSDTACRNCCYWEVNYAYEKEFEEEQKDPPVWSDLTGECHRHAPQPIPLIFTSIGQLLGESAFALNALANIEEGNPPTDYELGGTDIFGIHEWPITDAHHWCGEFARSK